MNTPEEEDAFILQFFSSQVYLPSAIYPVALLPASAPFIPAPAPLPAPLPPPTEPAPSLEPPLVVGVPIPPFSDENVKYLGPEILLEVHMEIRASQEAYCKEITNMMNHVCADLYMEPHDPRSMLVRSRLLGLQQVRNTSSKEGVNLLQSRRETLFQTLDTIVNKLRKRHEVIVDKMRNRSPQIIVPATPPPSADAPHSPFTPLPPTPSSTPPSFPPAGMLPLKVSPSLLQAPTRSWSLKTRRHLLLSSLPRTYRCIHAERSLCTSTH